MKFAHVLSRITGAYWLITQDALENINALIESRMFGVAVEPQRTESAAAPSAPSSTAIIPIQGVIGKRLSLMEMMCGGADIGAIEAAFDAANNDPAISRMVLHVDSPGGTVTGVPELAAKMYREKKKPLIAISDTLMASAAYYLASAADEIVVTPTANIGSIGVVAQVRETLNTNSADGRTRLRIFRSGADKMVGADAPLTDEQAAMFQARADELGAMFRADVIKARPNIADDSMTGKVYFGAESVNRHLADRVVRNLAEAIGDS